MQGAHGVNFSRLDIDLQRVMGLRATAGILAKACITAGYLSHICFIINRRRHYDKAAGDSPGTYIPRKYDVLVLRVKLKRPSGADTTP